MMFPVPEHNRLALQDMTDGTLVDSFGFRVYQEAGKASQPNLSSRRPSLGPTPSSIAIGVSI